MKTLFVNRFLISVLMLAALSGCMSLPTIEESGVVFSTAPAALPDSLVCLNSSGGQVVAKELINMKQQVVVIAGGSDPISTADWEDYNPKFPWRKNIDRYTLFTESCFYRSPKAPAGCIGDACAMVQTFSKHTWIELAEIVGVDFVPKDGTSSDPQTPDAGELSVKVIRKCHILTYEGEVYDLTDDQGNHYVMHATEQPLPSLEVSLPAGWSLRKDTLDQPLTVPPRGVGDDCYHVILSDHLGQGYHQYVFTQPFFPAE